MQLLFTLSIQSPLFSSLLCPPEAHPDYKHEHLCILVSFGAEIVRNTIKSKNTEEKKMCISQPPCLWVLPWLSGTPQLKVPSERCQLPLFCLHSSLVLGSGDSSTVSLGLLL